MHHILMTAGLVLTIGIGNVDVSANSIDDIPKRSVNQNKNLSKSELQDVIDKSVQNINDIKIDNDKDYQNKINEENKKKDEQKQKIQQEERQKQEQEQQKIEQQEKQKQEQKQKIEQQEKQKQEQEIKNQQNNQIDEQSKENVNIIQPSQNTDQLKFLHSSGFTPMLGVKLTYYNPSVLGWKGSSIQGGIHITPDINGIYKDDQNNIAIAANKSVAIGTKISTDLGRFIVVDHSEGNYDLVVNW